MGITCLRELEAAEADFSRRGEARLWGLPGWAGVCRTRAELAAFGCRDHDARDRKELLRTLLEEVTVNVERDKATRA